MSYLPRGIITKDTNNSTTSTLSASATYTGTATDVLKYNQVHLTLFFRPNEVPSGDGSTAQASLYFEFSPDGTNWDISVPVFIRSGIFIPQTLVVVDRYYRVRFINDGGTAAIADLGLKETAGTPTTQTAFRLNTYLVPTGTKELGRTLDQSVGGSDPVGLVRSVAMAKTPDDDYINIPVSGLDSGSNTKTPLTNTSVGTFTVDAGTDVVTLTSHGLSDTALLVLNSSTTLPAGLAVDTLYYVRDSAEHTFKLAATSGGTAIDITDTGTGTHTAYTPDTFTSNYQMAVGYASLLAFAFSDQKFSKAILQWSPDGSTKTTGLITSTALANISITGFETYIAVSTTIIDRYFRLELVNGSDDQTVMESDIWLHDKPFTGSFSTLDSAVTNLSTPLLTRAVIMGKKPDNTYVNVPLSDGGSFITANYGTEVVRGNVSGKTAVRVFGRDSAATTTSRLIWDVSSTAYPFLTSAIALRIKAGGNAADASSGAGARSITIYGLDGTGAAISETLDTNGESASSSTSATFYRINYAEVATAGAIGVANTAAITIETTGGVTVARIPTGVGKTRLALYSTPVNKMGYLRRVRVSAEGSKAGNFIVYTRKTILDVSVPVSPRISILSFDLVDGGTSDGFTLEFPIELAATSDIWVAGQASTGTAALSAELEIEVIDD